MPSTTLIIGVPLLLAGIVGAGWWIHRRGTGAPRSGSTATDADALPDREFEAQVVQAFERQGYQVIDAGKGTRALALRRDRETWLVQSRHRRLAKVGVEAIQSLHRDMTACGANGGFALTEGRFSREATALAASCNIKLVEGEALRGLLAAARGSRHGA